MSGGTRNGATKMGPLAWLAAQRGPAAESACGPAVRCCPPSASVPRSPPPWLAARRARGGRRSMQQWRRRRCSVPPAGWRRLGGVIRPCWGRECAGGAAAREQDRRQALGARRAQQDAPVSESSYITSAAQSGNFVCYKLTRRQREKCSTGLKLARTPRRSCILTAEVPSRSKGAK